MNDCNQDLRQTDELILRDEVSDEAIEAASVALRGPPTLMHNTYCFACPAATSAKMGREGSRCSSVTARSIPRKPMQPTVQRKRSPLTPWLV
jgi:hypothetical protein